jgi:hypothetical protein
MFNPKTPRPVAPDCEKQCPQVGQTALGTTYTYCSSCVGYMEQIVRDKNTDRILREQTD